MTNPHKFLHSHLPHKVHLQPFCSSVSHTFIPAPSPLCVYSPLYLQALTVVHASPHSCPLFSWPIYSLLSSQQRGRFLPSLPTSTSPALGGGSPQAGLHQQLAKASPGYSSCSIPKGSTLSPSPNLPHSSSQPPTCPHLGTVGKYGRCKGPEIPSPHFPMTSKCALGMTNPLSVLTPMRSIPVCSHSEG